MPDPLPYGRQWVDEDDVQAVVEVLRSDFLTTGPAVTRFEDALREATGASYAVAVNSGTAALHAMYHAAGLQAGDEVVTSPLTFAATANAALYLGATVRFADVDSDTGNISPQAVDDAITDRTKLVVAVDYAGQPADYDALTDVTRRRGVTVLSDAAHSLGATYKGRPVGRLTKASSLSFHPVKPVTTAEGGAVVTDDADIARRAGTFRTHGITRDPSDLRHPDEGPWWYEQQALGYNYRLTDVQAALGTSQMRKLGTFIAARRRIAKAYDEALASVPELRLPSRSPGAESGWHLYVVRTREPEHRRPLFEHLRAKGIFAQVHYIPVYWHPYYQALGYSRGLCPQAEEFYGAAVSLPIFPRMTQDDVQRVVEAIAAFFGRA